MFYHFNHCLCTFSFWCLTSSGEVFIIDPIPKSYRLTDKEITERIRYGVLSNRKKSKIPIIVSESYPQADIYRPFVLLTDNILQVS